MKTTLVDPTNLLPVHERTGLRALGLLPSGKPIWPALGGAEPSEEAEGTEDEESEGEEEDEEKDGEDKDDDKVVPQSTYDRIKKHLSASDKKKSELERELAALKGKDLPELDKVKGDLATVTEERDGLKTSFQNLARTNAFLMTSQQLNLQWINPATALKVGDFDEIEIADDGTVEGMEAVLKKLKKEHPYLIAKPKADDEEEEEATPPARKSGSAVGTRPRKTAGKVELTDEQITKRFPGVLR